jgi:fructose 1,6-bisphosphate aldolase/phosphatase
MQIAGKIAAASPSKEGKAFHELVSSVYSDVRERGRDINDLKNILFGETRFVCLGFGDQFLSPYLYSIGDIVSEEHRVIVAHAGRFAYKGSEGIRGGPRSVYLTLGRINGYSELGAKGVAAFRELIAHELADLACGHRNENIPVLTEANNLIDAKYKTQVLQVRSGEFHGATIIDTDKVSIEKYRILSDLGTQEVFAIKGSSKVHPDVPKGSRKINIMCAKADVGSKGGHGTVVQAMLEAVADVWARAAEEGKILDFFITRVGDDISVTVTHINGKDNEMMHRLVWDAFINATVVAKDMSLYGAGQDLLKDSFSGNVKGAGPGITELEFTERPSEPIIIWQADKCGPGVFNNAIAWIYTNPNSAFVALKPDKANRVNFGIVDFEHNNKAGREAVLKPSEMSGMAFNQAVGLIAGEQTRYSFTTLTQGGEDIGGVTATRLHNIAGEYTGKDDPMAVFRSQKDLPAEGLFTAPFFRLYPVFGWMMGSYKGFFLPVSLPEARIGVNDGPPLISAFGFNINNGRLLGFMDLFAANPAVRAVQLKVGNATSDMLSRTDLWTDGEGRAPAAETAYQRGLEVTQSTIPWVETAAKSSKGTPSMVASTPVVSAVRPTPNIDIVRSDIGAKARLCLETPIGDEALRSINEAVAETAAKPVQLDAKTGFIFGERAAFGKAITTKQGTEYEPGLGVLLPRFVRAGIKVAVIAKTDKERLLIAELNADNLGGTEIAAVGSLEEAKAVLSAARYNYFKTKDDPDATEDRSITVYDVTNLVKRIIEALGHEFALAAEEITRLQDAAIRFAQAA